MLQKCFILFVIDLVLFGTADCKKLSDKDSRKSESNGPIWVKKSLTENNIFETPVFQFTNKYDQYKQYSNIKGLLFNGLSYHSKPTKVFCWYGIPETLKKGAKVPAVVLVHGGGGTVFPEWVKKWTDCGYAAISIALEGQVPGPKTENSPLEVKHPTHKYSGPYRKGFFIDIMNEELEDQWFYHAVADVIMANSLICSFPEIDTSRIGITGISWGGILINVITGIDHRYAFSIPVYGCGFLYESPTYAKQLKLLTPKARKFYLENWEPSLYVPLQKQPTLFVNGSNDCHFPMNSFTDTYKASTNEKFLHIEYNMPHGHRPGWTPKEIYSFADYIVYGGIQPPKYTLNNLENNGRLEYSYEYKGKLKDAFLFYTTDTSDWGCKNYQWTKIAARISEPDSTIVGFLPKDAVYYFINAHTDDGLMFSSPMQKASNK